ncbi:MAG: PEP-CTERM sorting domain-containing protein [Alphaproteobacteria bacterium]|nr:PEP-CTERM sorting domain-containing protein [Alphaproteobacteria bacterium]
MKVWPCVIGLGLLAAAPAYATTVSQIGGGYDTTCDQDPICAAALAGGATFYANLANSPSDIGPATPFVSPAHGWDDPSLFIYNLTAHDFTSAQLQGLGYQGANNGVLQLAPGFPTTILANSVYQYSWPDYPNGAYCGLGAGELFAYDYDDTYGCTGSAQPGNVSLLFSAMWNGQAITTTPFSPNSNISGTFVGFEGLDPNGYAETAYDDHNGAPNGYLANIVVGSSSFNVPEPMTLSLFGFGLAGAAVLRRRRKADKAA